ncbi:unnamed protein product [Phyllotreta striolata]|uniref:Uncharacterized protein n=1 Tax=Phyllotreta striolata TaxID=444603 RepID=A0A9N9TKD8_PHYSR|nr:unnamed protein product [Phyllotreta striolata]
MSTVSKFTVSIRELIRKKFNWLLPKTSPESNPAKNAVEVRAESADLFKTHEEDATKSEVKLPRDSSAAYIKSYLKNVSQYSPISRPKSSPFGIEKKHF